MSGEKWYVVCLKGVKVDIENEKLVKGIIKGLAEDLQEDVQIIGSNGSFDRYIFKIYATADRTETFASMALMRLDDFGLTTHNRTFFAYTYVE